MKAGIKKKWVKALLSGKYNQGKAFLKRTIDDTTYHCCLGVLCELAKEAGVVEETIINYSGPGTVYVFCDGLNFTALPKGVMDWAGVDQPAVHIRKDSNSIKVTHTIGTYLTLINDHGASFEEIAEIIKRQL